MAKLSQVLVTVTLALVYGFTDINGKQPGLVEDYKYPPWCS